jgi:hypothetical protein
MAVIFEIVPSEDEFYFEQVRKRKIEEEIVNTLIYAHSVNKRVYIKVWTE